MSENDKTQTTETRSASTKAAKAVKSAVQEAFDEANEKGYFGSTPDEKPNSAYTVAGVTKGKK